LKLYANKNTTITLQHRNISTTTTHHELQNQL
jgi:hypothetical protein